MKVLVTKVGLGPVVQTIWVVVKESIGQSIPSMVTAVFATLSKKLVPTIVIYVPPIVVPKSCEMLVIFAVLSSLNSTASVKVITWLSRFWTVASHM